MQCGVGVEGVEKCEGQSMGRGNGAEGVAVLSGVGWPILSLCTCQRHAKECWYLP